MDLSLLVDGQLFPPPLGGINDSPSFELSSPCLVCDRSTHTKTLEPAVYQIGMAQEDCSEAGP